MNSIVPQFAGIPAGARCGNCAHGQIAPSPNGQIDIQKRYCFEGPPQAIPVPQYKRGISGMEPSGLQIMFSFPQVEVGQRCHRWAAKPPGEPNDADKLSVLSSGSKAS